MNDELKPFAWCYQTIAGVIVFQKWPTSDKEWAQRNNDVDGATKYPNAHSVTDLFTADDLATLRTQLAAMTAERDAERAKVALLRKVLDRVNGMACYASEEATEWRAEMLLEIGKTARNALESTK